MNIRDDYFHDSPGVFYVVENIPCDCDPSPDDAEASEIHDSFNSQNESCTCTADNCIGNADCACLRRSNAVEKPVYENQRMISSSLNRVEPIYECNSNCSCSALCGNRLVQFGPSDRLEVRRTASKGFGLFASAVLEEGSFVCEYAGEVVTKAEALKRSLRNKSEGRMNYIFCLNEHFGETRVRTVVDPATFGNVGRYLNHSCRPNCVIVPVRVDTPIPKLCVFARRRVSADEELTFSFGSSEDSNVSTIEKRIPCLCGALECKKYLPYEDYG